MIRIDEIYNNTFWPWIRRNLPATRMFFCDPSGPGSLDKILNFGDSQADSNYIWFHDQEPIYLDIHQTLFEDIVKRNLDLQHCRGPKHAVMITSERKSEYVAQCCGTYGWRSFYYFYHGWAALDWYRGYDRTYLMPAPKDRLITHSFISPNRIIGGRRDHRVMLMHYLHTLHVTNALISFPAVCPYENVTAFEIASRLGPEVAKSISSINLPLCFDGETDHPMHSCWLSLFSENAQCCVHVVTETVFHGHRHHLTEKTFKPICLRMPFVIVGAAGSLDYLRSYGFKTFGQIWDEGYDLEIDDNIRLQKIAALLKYFDTLSQSQLQQMYLACLPILEHNYQHFYGGTFEQVLWQELQLMLQEIKLHVSTD